MFPARYFPVRYFPVRYFLSGGGVGSVSTTGYFYKYKTNIYVSTSDNSGADATNTVQIAVRDFSFNQQSLSVLVSRETLDPTQSRDVKPYVTALLPVEFSFSTYISPLLDTNVTSPEENLWIGLMGSDSLTSDSSSSEIDFADGNVQTLQNLTLWFEQTDQNEGNYRIDNAIIDSATINFSINEHATIEWRGRALAITSDNSMPAATERLDHENCLKN